MHCTGLLTLAAGSISTNFTLFQKEETKNPQKQHQFVVFICIRIVSSCRGSFVRLSFFFSASQIGLLPLSVLFLLSGQS